jgi:hypothetical protein
MVRICYKTELGFPTGLWKMGEPHPFNPDLVYKYGKAKQIDFVLIDGNEKLYIYNRFKNLPTLEWRTDLDKADELVYYGEMAQFIVMNLC